MDRILSEQEILEVIYHGESEDIATVYERDKHIAAAQLAKTDQEWIEWINKLPYEQFDKEGFPTENDSEVTQRMFLIGYETLKNRKQEIWQN